ncbi:MAG: peptidase m56 family protein, partial [Chthonomonadales bacterium]|nr:peptidase m56 family protein [Chthonomonadales bacterium]
MTAAWIESWDRGSLVWAGSLGRACWQGGTALVVVWLLCQAFATMSPTLRAWLWRLAYLKLVLTLLLPPILVPVLPARTIAPIHTSAPATDSVPGEVVPNTGSVSLPDASPSPSLPEPLSSGFPFRLSWTFWLSLCWGTGVVWCLVRVAGEWIAAGWLRGLSEPVQDEALTASCLELSNRLGLRNPPQLMVSEGAGSPVLLGGSHPAIILPLALLAECSQSELELVIAHELAHHTRRDLLWGWAPALGHALFFFFPLEWLAAHEYRLAQEMACDELAIRTSRVHVGDYGEALLKVAARHRPNLQSRLVTIGIVESSHILKRRLLAMKEMGSFPVRPGMAVTAIVSVGLLGCIPWQLAPRALAEGASAFDKTAGSARTTSAGQPDSSYRTESNAAVTPGDDNAVRYHPKAGESYVYAVKIETTASDYTETMSGNATY